MSDFEFSYGVDDDDNPIIYQCNAKELTLATAAQMDGIIRAYQIDGDNLSAANLPDIPMSALFVDTINGKPPSEYGAGIRSIAGVRAAAFLAPYASALIPSTTKKKSSGKK